MANVDSAWQYLIGLHAEKNEILIGNVIRGRIVMCSKLINGKDFVYLYKKVQTQAGEEYIIRSISLDTIVKELQDAGFHGHYWVELPSHIAVIEIWNTGAYNF